MLDPLAEDHAVPFSPQRTLGPFDARLAAMEEILPPLAAVADYRHYLFLDTIAAPDVNELRVMYQEKSQIGWLRPTLGTFESFTVIFLLPLLATIKGALDALGNSKP